MQRQLKYNWKKFCQLHAMSNLPLFYQKVAPLSREKHRDWRIEPTTNYAFAAKTNSVYIAGAEFMRAAKEYPIVFSRRADGAVFPVVLLGFKNEQNLFVDNKGTWQAGYIPAYVRRYPFILAETSQDGEANFTVCLDEAYEGFTRSRDKGQTLFDEAGEPSGLLEHSMEFLKEYQGHINLTNAFCKQLQALDLLETVRADIALADGEKQALGGFLCVNRSKLKQLQTDKLAHLVQRDQLELVYSHLLSLSNLDNLLKRGNMDSQQTSQSRRKVN